MKNEWRKKASSKTIGFILTLGFIITLGCSSALGIDGGVRHDPAVSPPPTAEQDTSQQDEPMIFLFAADLHLYPDNIGNIYDKRLDKTGYTPGYQRLKKLIKRWNTETPTRMFLLGDILEAPEFNKREIYDCGAGKYMLKKEMEHVLTKEINDKWDSEVKEFFDLLTPLKDGPQKLRMILGNNDARNNGQTRSFVNKIVSYHDYQTAKPKCLNDLKDLVWTEKINDSVAAMGIYLPDKIENIEDDHFFNLDVLHRVIKIKMREIIASQKDVKLIFILTHQGFLEDEFWALQFEVREFTMKKRADAKEKLDKWKKCIKNVRKVLKKFDNDAGGGKTAMPDIVVVSGHSHKGFFIHSPNRIEHIVCPSLAQGDRDIKGVGEGAYLRIKYYPEKKARLEVVYDNIYKEKTPKASRATLYL